MANNSIVSLDTRPALEHVTRTRLHNAVGIESFSMFVFAGACKLGACFERISFMFALMLVLVFVARAEGCEEPRRQVRRANH